MTDACRQKISDLWDNGNLHGANAALIRDRFLKVISTEDEKAKQKARKTLFEKMQAAAPLSSVPYKAAFERYKYSLANLAKEDGDFVVTGRMIVGLGSENVIETGITLHHTYGVPVIPGSALKGLASHYCNQVWGQDKKFCKIAENNVPGEYYTTLFGTSEDSGHIQFHDAWIIPESLKNIPIRADIMTPHHGDYYSGTLIRTGTRDEEEIASPTDFDKPNPVTFLSVTGRFYIAVSCDIQGENGNGKKWACLAFQLLSDALREWGVGGKTSAGYGRMITIAGKPISGATAQQSSGPRYEKGNTATATRFPDPKGRDRPYFKADDGVGGFVNPANHPSLAAVKIGESLGLKVAGVNTPPEYAFTIPLGQELPEKSKNNHKQ